MLVFKVLFNLSVTNAEQKRARLDIALFNFSITNVAIVRRATLIFLSVVPTIEKV